MYGKEAKTKKIFYSAIVIIAILILINLLTMPLRGYSEETANNLLYIFFEIILLVIIIVSLRMLKKN
jgi:hypothetical protein